MSKYALITFTVTVLLVALAAAHEDRWEEQVPTTATDARERLSQKDEDEFDQVASMTRNFFEDDDGDDSDEFSDDDDVDEFDDEFAQSRLQKGFSGGIHFSVGTPYIHSNYGHGAVMYQPYGHTRYYYMGYGDSRRRNVVVINNVDPGKIDPRTCNRDTGGTCKWYSCHDSRNSICVSGKCVCPGLTNGPGLCALQGTCVEYRIKNQFPPSNDNPDAP
jgi:hypothetical protein